MKVRHRVLILALCLLLPGVLSGGAAQAARETPAARSLIEDLEFPTGIAFGFGKMFINERPGRIRVVEKGELLARPLAVIPTITSGETGLLGIAVPPDETDRAVYVFATEEDGDSNTVWRVPLDDGPPERIVEGLPADLYHNGGGVAFDREGMLLVSNGETHETERAQDPGQPGGKVLRFTPDGEPGPGGPFPGSAALSIGHRNPFGLTIDPISGAPWVSENGPDAFDEINRIEAGGNYGWPLVAGPGCDEIDVERCVEPAASYEEIIVPTGLAFAPRNAPAGVAGHLFFGTYGGGIHELTLDEQRREVVADELLPNSDESIVAVAWGPEGLYYSTPVALKVIPYGTAEGKGDGAASPPPSSAKPQSGGAEGRGTVGFAVVLVLLVGLFAASRRRLFR